MKASRFNKDITVELLKAIQSKIKKDNTNSVEFEKPIEDKQHLLKKDVVNNRATQKNSKVSDWANQLIKICSQYSGDDYYVADLIPQRKLKNAMETYPIPGGGAVIALIDATLLGSAENGMIIDERGISWHNALGHKSKLTLMNWEDFSTKEIMVCGDFISSSIIIGEGNEFDMSGSRFNKDKTVELLKAIQLKIKKANSVEFEKSIENKQHLLKEDSVNNRTTQKLGKVSDWVKQLTEVCSWYAANDYYVAELIPPRKLKNVMETYPIAGGGAVVALIDATLLGSAENGMIIGERGIRWHNDLGHNSKLTSMNWGDFSTINIKREDDDIIIGEGNRFNMAGSSFDKDITVELLKAIQLKIKTPSTNSVGLEKSIENEQHLLKKDSVHKRATKKTSEASVWVNQLTKICSQYSGDNYDITELIPPKKLKIAMETYPIPGGGSVIALIDTTLLGSAKNGMIIGERGISWHSGVMNGFRLTAMSWDKFSTKNIKRDGVDIIIGEGNEFGMSGSHFDIDKTVELLIAIQSKIKKPNTNSAELEKPIENKQHLLKTHSVNNGATKKTVK